MSNERFFDPMRSVMKITICYPNGSSNVFYSRIKDNQLPERDIAEKLAAMLSKLHGYEKAFINRNQKATGRGEIVATADSTGVLKFI